MASVPEAANGVSDISPFQRSLAPSGICPASVYGLCSGSSVEIDDSSNDSRSIRLW